MVPTSSYSSYGASPLFSPFGQRLRGGGKTYRVNFWGGENVLQSVLSKTTFGGLRNWGWSGRRLFLSREMTESRQKMGGGKTYRRRGVQKRLWGGVFRRIYGMFSTPLSFPPPLAALWPFRESHIDSWLQYLWKLLQLQFLSRYFCITMPSFWLEVLYTSPICITILLPFILGYFCRSIKVRGRWNTPHFICIWRSLVWDGGCYSFQQRHFCEQGKNRDAPAPSQSPGKNDFLEELRMTYVIFKISISG